MVLDLAPPLSNSATPMFLRCQPYLRLTLVKTATPDLSKRTKPSWTMSSMEKKMTIATSLQNRKIPVHLDRLRTGKDPI
jgi:hypothetical protein